MTGTCWTPTAKCKSFLGSRGGWKVPHKQFLREHGFQAACGCPQGSARGGHGGDTHSTFSRRQRSRNIWTGWLASGCAARCLVSVSWKERPELNSQLRVYPMWGPRAASFCIAGTLLAVLVRDTELMDHVGSLILGKQWRPQRGCLLNPTLPWGSLAARGTSPDLQSWQDQLGPCWPCRQFHKTTDNRVHL